MSKVFLLLLIVTVITVLSLIFVKVITSQAISSLPIQPAGPGLGWHNDWWNPETQKVQKYPYIPSQP